MNNTAAGVLATAVGAFFFGTNFMVTKNYNMKDGFTFQFLMGTGIVIVGILSLFTSQGSVRDDFQPVFSVYGLIGGAIWSVGNSLTVLIVRNVGLGIGLSIWSGLGIVISFIIGLTPVMGLHPVKLNHMHLGVIGITLGATALAVFAQVKTHQETSKGVRHNEGYVEECLEMAKLDIEVDETQKPTTPPLGRLVGVGLAFISGLSYGLYLVPLTYWNQHHKPPEGLSELRFHTAFFFSQFAGIFLGSFIIYVAYCIYTHSRPAELEGMAAIASVLSGMMWAVASMGSMVSTVTFGLSIGQSLTVNGALLVNGLMSFFVYGEIRGRRNVMLFVSGCVLNITSTLCLAFA